MLVAFAAAPAPGEQETARAVIGRQQIHTGIIALPLNPMVVPNPLVGGGTAVFWLVTGAG
jgi:hypothetical protein